MHVIMSVCFIRKSMKVLHLAMCAMPQDGKIKENEHLEDMDNLSSKGGHLVPQK